MKRDIGQLTLAEWDARYAVLKAAGLTEPAYGGALSRHLGEGDTRLRHLCFDGSIAALDLWNFFLTEDERLRAARRQGKKIVGTMKDLGTVPVMAYALPNLVAFYPDGAWWIPCLMELSGGLFRMADELGVDDSFCPVRAMLGAFVNASHFPAPDLLVCSVGAVCDDFSAIAQRVAGLGHAIHWWEIPYRRAADGDEATVRLPGGVLAPRAQVEWVGRELLHVRQALESVAGMALTDARLADGIHAANRVRRCLQELRRLAFVARPAPLPALELLIAEMLAIHFCSDRDESLRVLSGLLAEVQQRIAAGAGLPGDDRARVFWVNPVADLRVMNVLESCGGRLAGTEYLFLHALDEIPEDRPPIEALARTALSDPMIGSSAQRAQRICREARRFEAEAIIVSRIPGASHCAWEGRVIADIAQRELGLPVVELDVPPLCDAMLPSLRTRIEAVIEVVMQRRQS